MQGPFRRSCFWAVLAVAIISLMNFSVPLSAEEGLWLLDQIEKLDQAKLREMGLELEPSEIWNSEAAEGLASAVVSLGGCSASFVSSDGLVVTNHHCVFGAVQYHTTPENNIIRDGFLAPDCKSELKSPGSHVYVFEGFEDVTDRVLAAVPDDADGSARYDAVEKINKTIVKECEAGGDLRCRVASMWGGLRYILYRQLDIKDVRLVHVPAQGIGEFGGDVDNWMWPRHTGDYSFLRAYVGPDGKPADYSEDNVPYKPKRWLKVSSAGVSEDSFALLMGYPGRTMRYRTSYSVREAQERYYPERIERLSTAIATLEEISKQSPDAAIKNSTGIKYMNNSLKNSHGMVDGLSSSGLLETKEREERELTDWIAADPVRTERFGSVFDGFASVYDEQGKTAARDGVFTWSYRASSLLGAANTLLQVAEEMTKPDMEREPKFMERNLPRQKQSLVRMQRRLYLPSDRALLHLLLKEAAALPEGQRIVVFDELVFAEDEDPEVAINAFLDKLYAGTKLDDQEFRMSLFGADYETLLASDDSFIQLARAMAPMREKIEEADKKIDGTLSRLRPLYVQALHDFRGGLIFPDANSTLRANFGTVVGYSPRDAVDFFWLTGLKGVLEKDTGKKPFNSPKEFLDAAGSSDPSPYLDPAIKDIPVNFLATLDSTGGNSGSPVMDGAGNLIGLLFDGNYESMASDWRFDTKLTRSIMVDIRYVLWNLDRVYDAKHLIEELGDPYGVLEK